MTYVPDKPPIAADTDLLRARIPGWGADLDPADRPSVPRERFDDTLAGAQPPEQQPERWPRERSVEHTRLPPVFGTSCPPRGASGAIRRFSYARYSEGQTAHWLLLMAGDRVDVLESALRSFATGRPDNPVTQTGVVAELRRHGVSSRLGRGRADLKHQWIDPVVVAGPWVLAALGAYRVLRRVGRLGRALRPGRPARPARRAAAAAAGAAQGSR